MPKINPDQSGWKEHSYEKEKSKGKNQKASKVFEKTVNQHDLTILQKLVGRAKKIQNDKQEKKLTSLAIKTIK